MRRGCDRRADSVRTAFAALGARLALLAVLVTLVAQTLAFGAHAARASQDPRAAAAALSAAVGAPVILCVQDGAPSDDETCPSGCPLCHLAAQTLALHVPDAPPQLTPPPLQRVERPTPPRLSRLLATPRSLPFARGPPGSL